MKAKSAGPAENFAGKALALIGLTLLAYLPALRSGFIWDDNIMLSQHGLIQASDGLRRLWLTAQAVDYWPVTASTFWLEWRLWGAHPAGYHATNLALHIAGALLLWAVLRRIQAPGAFAAALLFAVHPVNVESVAWIAQRKNLLALLFYLLSIWFFLQTENVASAANRLRNEELAGRAKWCWLSLFSFALAMLSKGSTAMLPAVLLGLILWRRRPVPGDWARLAPFAVVAIALVGVNVWFQHQNAGDWVRSAGWVERLLGAGAVVWFYLGKAVLPLRLMFVYPQWRIDVANPLWWLPLLGAGAVTGSLFFSRSAAWGRPALFAWGYFCLSLVPVMGFTDVYFMRYSLVADHYEHLAIIAVCAGAAALWDRGLSGKRGARVAAAAAVCALAALTWRQCRMYRDTSTLFRTTLESNPACWMAHNNLGVILRNEGKAAEAMLHFRTAVDLNPGYTDARNNLGAALTDAGRYSDAIAEYGQALRIAPRSAAVLAGLGGVYLRLGKNSTAITYYESALAIEPGAAGTHNSLGMAFAGNGQLPEALAQYSAALRLLPDFPEAEVNWGNALEQNGRDAEAIAHYARAARLNPSLPEAQFGLGNALAGEGRVEEAVERFKSALRLRPGFFEAGNNLATNLYRLGRIEEAARALEEVVRLNPDYLAAHYNLGVALRRLGRTEEAQAQFDEAARLRARQSR